MTHKIVVRQGGASDATDKDYTDQVPHISVGESPEGLWTAGMLYGQGRSTQFQFRITDDTNEIRALGTAQIEPHNKVTITEDAPGYDCLLAVGRIARKDVGRGDLELGDAREWEVTADDANMDLRGMDLVDVWERPEETGTERLLALGAAFLNGSPRPSTVITVARWAASGESHLVKPNPDDGEATMPAQTYEVGTKLVDIIADCAETEGQEWGVVIHHGSGESHLCFMYTEEDDWDTYPSALAISDVPGEVDNDTTFAPIWDSGAAMEQDGQEVLSGIVSEYGDDRAHVVLVDPTLVDQFDYWVEKITDATTTTQAGATARAPHLLRGRSQEHVTHQLTLKLPADKVNLLAAGMSIDIRADASRHEESLGGTATRRIAKLTWEPIAPEVGEVLGSYYAHLELDRPEKIARERRQARPGPKGPSGGTTASCALPTAAMTQISTPNSGFEDGDTDNWTINQLGGTGLVGPGAGAWEGDYYYDIGSAGYIFYTVPGPYTFLAGTTYVARVLHVAVGDATKLRLGYDALNEVDFGEVAATPTLADWVETCIEWTPASNRTSNVQVGLYVESSLDTFGIDGVRIFVGAAADSPAPIGGTGDADPGESGVYAGQGHVHEHPHLTAGGPYHEAADSTITDAGGYFTGTDVEAALQELGAGSGYTDEQAQDAIGTILTDSATIDFTYADGGPSITASVIGSGISALGFVGPILISDTPSSPLVFDDLLQNDDGDDLLYADI